MSSLSLRSILETSKLVGANYDDWYRNLRIVLMHEKLINIIDKPAITAPANTNDAEATKTYQKSSLAVNAQVGPHVLKMIDLIEQLEKLGCTLGKELSQDLILQSLPDSFSQFIVNFNMNKMSCDLHEMLNLLIDYENQGLKITRWLKKGEINLQVGNGANVAALALGSISLNMPMAKFRSEVEKQTGNSIKVLRSDRGGEYLSENFIDYLRENGILSQWTPPGTPQHNGVSERRNRTLLDMVSTTPYEIWKGRKPNLKHIKVWGCPAYVKKLQTDKLEARSDKCRFIGYPKETMGYYFYHPLDHKVFVARGGTFLERNFLQKGVMAKK
ncbi:Retrovirus-related Pol polyprotein from transposon TNT 1-94 [Vitis vinifera]|uniref:Retrovirus-related Pol polyprotein from transposon TNT 1-94 n=1 Tax=Vitis vinifera TaxID=29760 RepID=A0A438EPW4_VITVI|nr:Retrovirus-related Pol polyprotein from transposon TNT 1-94 [Vitis vinifera]